MRNLTLTLIFSFFIIVQYGNAQTEKGTVLLGGNASFQSVDDESLFMLNPNIGYFVANRFALGLNANYVSSDGTSILGLGPYARGYFVTTERGSLFAQAGYNFLRVSSGNFSDSASGYGLGLGYAIFLNSSVAMEISGNYAKYNFTNINGGLSGGDNAILSFNVGFQIHLGK